MPIISGKIKPDGIVCTDSCGIYGFPGYQSVSSIIIIVSTTQQGLPGVRRSYQWDENFWKKAKRILRKYNDIQKYLFPLFLKECEFLFNYGSAKQQLETIRVWYEI